MKHERKSKPFIQDASTNYIGTCINYLSFFFLFISSMQYACIPLKIIAESLSKHNSFWPEACILQYTYLKRASSKGAANCAFLAKFLLTARTLQLRVFCVTYITSSILGQNMKTPALHWHLVIPEWPTCSLFRISFCKIFWYY